MLDPARFALHLGTHLLARYEHVSATFVTVEQLRWARISSDSSEAGQHPHAFWRDGAEKRFVEVEVARQSDGGGGAVARVAGGLRDLLGAELSFSFFPRAAFNDNNQKTPQCSSRLVRRLRISCGTSIRRCLRWTTESSARR